MFLYYNYKLITVLVAVFLYYDCKLITVLVTVFLYYHCRLITVLVTVFLYCHCKLITVFLYYSCKLITVLFTVFLYYNFKLMVVIYFLYLFNVVFFNDIFCYLSCDTVLTLLILDEDGGVLSFSLVYQRLPSAQCRVIHCLVPAVRWSVFLTNRLIVFSLTQAVNNVLHTITTMYLSFCVFVCTVHYQNISLLYGGVILL